MQTVTNTNDMYLTDGPTDRHTVTQHHDANNTAKILAADVTNMMNEDNDHDVIK
jgi:uncharacterized protein YgiM (DUF1202 family)